jgi:dihydrofolate reductase
MAGKVFFSVSMSLDGFIAPESLEDLMGQQWMELQQWIFPQRFFRENLKLGEGGEEGRNNDIVRETFERTGASVMGKRMFDAGEQAWPEEAPFHTPVFVVTHEKRDPWQRLGGTTFHFVNDGIESALDQAREAAGDRDVRIAGGGATILEYLNAGLIDEFSIALSPVLFGSGIRLFEGVDAGRVALEPVRAAGAAGDPPDLRSPGTVTLTTSALRCRGQQCGASLDALASGRANVGAAILAGRSPGGTSRPCRGASAPAQVSPTSNQRPLRAAELTMALKLWHHAVGRVRAPCVDADRTGSVGCRRREPVPDALQRAPFSRRCVREERRSEHCVVGESRGTKFRVTVVSQHGEPFASVVRIDLASQEAVAFESGDEVGQARWAE